MEKKQQIIYGLYDDETILLDAIKKAKDSNMEIMDVYSPFPVHGLDPILGLEESRLHIAGFIYGLLGFLTAFLGMSWIFTNDWPIIFGGKPYWSVPAFVPIMFEMTVLFAAVGMTFSFYIVSGLGYGVETNRLDDRITDDKFAIAFEKEDVSIGDARSFFKETGASEMNFKEFDIK